MPTHNQSSEANTVRTAAGVGDILGGIANAMPHFARAIELRKTPFGGTYSPKELPRRGRIAPFGEQIVDTRLRYTKGCILGEQASGGHIVSFDLRTFGTGTDYRVRIARTPTTWDPARGGSPLREGGEPDKYVLAMIPIDQQGEPVQGKDWRMIYAGTRFDEIGAAPGMCLSRIEERSEDVLAQLEAANPGTRPERFEFKTAYPRDPAAPVLLFPEHALVENVVGYR